MLPMDLPVLRILRGERGIADDQQVLRVPVLSRLGLVKLKLPVRTVSPSMMMTLLWAMAWLASIMTGTPWFARKSAEEYFSAR
jgi:hypothetical protein